MSKKEDGIKTSMSVEEIVNSYKQAKHPEKQIAILAELNVVQPSVILGILSDAGISVPDKASKRTRKPQKQASRKLDRDWIYRLSDEGKNTSEIAKITGYVYASVWGALNDRKKRQTDNATVDVVQTTPPSAKTLIEYVTEYTELKAVIAEHKERLKQLQGIILNELESDELA